MTCVTSTSGAEGPALRLALSLVEAGEWLIWDKSTLYLLWSQKSQLRTNLKKPTADGDVPGSDIHASAHVTHFLTAFWASSFPVTKQIRQEWLFPDFHCLVFSLLLGALALFSQEPPKVSK